MRIKNKKTSKRTVLVGSILAIILIAGVAFIYLFKSHNSFLGWQPFPEQQNSNINYDKPTDDQKKAGSATKQSATTKDSSKSSAGSESDQPAAPVLQTNGKGKVDLIITAKSVNGPTLQIRSIISAVTDKGTCTLTLTNGGASVTKTSDVQSLPSTSTCKGFDIPITEISTGTWQISLQFNNNTLEANTTDTVVIQ